MNIKRLSYDYLRILMIFTKLRIRVNNIMIKKETLKDCLMITCEYL